MNLERFGVLGGYTYLSLFQSMIFFPHFGNYANCLFLFLVTCFWPYKLRVLDGWLNCFYSQYMSFIFPNIGPIMVLVGWKSVQFDRIRARISWTTTHSEMPWSLNSSLGCLQFEVGKRSLVPNIFRILCVVWSWKLLSNLVQPYKLWLQDLLSVSFFLFIFFKEISIHCVFIRCVHLNHFV